MADFRVPINAPLSEPVSEWRGGGLARHFSFLPWRVTQPMLAALGEEAGAAGAEKARQIAAAISR